MSFWGLNESKYVLTDEYINDLWVYDLPLHIFYKNYQPLNLDNFAIVYLVHKDPKVDYKSIPEAIQIDSDRNKENIDIQKVVNQFPGLRRESKPNDSTI